MEHDVGLELRISRSTRSRSRISAIRPSITTPVSRSLSASVTAYSAGSEFSITSSRAAPNVTTRSQISEPIEPPPPVTITALPRTSASRRA
jgi:hypothetical protein